MPESRFDQIWYGGVRPPWLLRVLGWLWRYVAALRSVLYQQRILRASRVTVPVIVIGNLTAGGTGKTPLTVYVARFLQELGHHPGIASRGHGRSSTGLQWVRADSTAADVGDEPLLLQQRTGLPVCVAARRIEAARALVAAGCDVVLFDDGLQHLALARDLEICVVDGARGFGNGLFVPAGPLREPRSRLRSVDLVVINAAADAPLAADVPTGLQMRLVGDLAWPVDGSQAPRPLTEFAGTELHAVAAIGNPGRFFAQLRRAGLTPVEHAFGDHHQYSAADLQFAQGQVLLMTEKDAVKCRSFAAPGHWYVPVEATFEAADTQRLQQRLRALFTGRDLLP